MPALVFLDGLPDKVVAVVVAVLEGIADDLGGSSIVAIDGLSKPKRSAADPKDHLRAIRLRDEFRARRTVLE